MDSNSDVGRSCGPFMPAVYYNIRYTGRSKQEKLSHRQQHLESLMAKFTMVGISELHVSEAEAQSLLFSHLPSHIPFYHCGPNLSGQAILFERKWAAPLGIGDEASRGVTWDHEVVVEGAMHAVWWVEGENIRGFLNIYLSARSERERVRQLRAATAWMTDFRRKIAAQRPSVNLATSLEWSFGGDRNFVSCPEHRFSSSSQGHWHPGTGVLQAWDAFEHAMGHGAVAEQAEFTWERVSRTREGNLSYCREVIDVAGISVPGFKYINVLASSSVIEKLPYPSASDHKPVSLVFRPVRRLKRTRDAGAPRLFNIPEWIADDTRFVQKLEEVICEWKLDRQPGLAGIEELNNLFAAEAKDFLRTTHVLARSTLHRFEVASSLLSKMQHSPHVPARYVYKALQVYPILGDILTVEVDLDDNGSEDNLLQLQGEQRLREHVMHLAAELVQQREEERRTSRPDDLSPHHGSMQVNSATPGCIQAAKRCLQLQQDVVTAVWDEQSEAFEGDPRRVAQRLQASASARQYRDRGDSNRGERFLSQWSCDLRNCRLQISDIEMTNILLEISPRKRPGPNGVPGIFYKLFAKHVVSSFLEAFDELQRENVRIPDSLGERLWKVIPKVPGANTQAQLRDLEMPNEHRKVLARALARVLDEQASRTMSQCQHAFLRSRSISNANVALGEGYYAANDRDVLRYWLLLDCTKGYNYLSWGWLTRVLTRAGLPQPLMRAVQRLVQHGNSVILVFRTHTCARLAFNSGLAQGCPLSCVLYVLAVDPFLEFVAGMDSVGTVIGFCDDWNVECLSAAGLHTVQEAGEEFEQCSGQQFNRIKSKVLPTRRLLPGEADVAQQRWPGCPVVSRAKVLGLWYGHGCQANEIGQEIEAKYYARMGLLRALPCSFAAKVILLDVFLRSLWSYVNRHMLIPTPVRRRVEASDSSFLVKVPYFALGLISHVSKLYGLRVHLQDFELANIAGLISTARLVERSGTPAARLLRESARESGVRQWQRPSYAFATAYGFYRHTVGETVASTLYEVESVNAGRLPDGIFKTVYRKLADADRSHWIRYWERRVQQRGLDASVIRRSLSALSSGVSQGERWSCLRLHLNAVPTDSRLRFMEGVDGQHVCYLCQGGVDSQEHIFGECPTVGCLKDKLAEDGVDMRTLTYRQHCLDATPGSLQAPEVVRFNDVVLTLRRLCRSHSFGNLDTLVSHGLCLYRSPGLRGGAPARRRRRQDIVQRPRVRANYRIYRAEGLCKSQDRSRKHASRAVMCVEPMGGSVRSLPTIRSWRYLGNGVTSNQAGYHAVLAALEHAVGTGGANVCIQTANPLVVNHANCVWACRSGCLQLLLSAMWSRMRALERDGRHVIIEYVHRRYIGDTAAMAQHALRTRSSALWFHGRAADLE